MEAHNADQALFVKMVLMTWHSHNERVNKLLTELSDEQLMADTAPGRNRGIYLIGHLAAVTDAMMPMMWLGNRLYPDLDEAFIKNPDRSGVPMPSVSEVRARWSKVLSESTSRMAQLAPADWFTRHNAVSPEDFAKEPHRNKLNMVINRTNHLAYHLGQLVYLGKPHD